VTPPIKRVVLVGFMASGKSCVGKLLAGRLGWGFRDFDEEIIHRVGLPIPEIFRQHGEAWFRELEGRVGEELMRTEGVVLASGGGWPAIPGRMEKVDSSTLTVWLSVTPEEAVRRALKEGSTRPLLAVNDPLEAARTLLEHRIAFYEKAHLAIDSGQMEPEELAREIEGYVNERRRH
jgi:shikimate kinase